MENTKKVMYLLAELEQILHDAEASQENVVSGRNLRWEEINFMQLARDCTDRIHRLEDMLSECVLAPDDMRRLAKRMNAISDEFRKFGKDIYAKAYTEWKQQIAKKDEAIQKQFPDPMIDLGNALGALLPAPKGWFLAAEMLGMAWNVYQKSNEKKADAKAKEAKERYQQFKRTTKGFCDSFQSFQGLCEDMNRRLKQQEEEARQAEVKKRSSGGRPKSRWYGGSWAECSEEEVREKLREVYDRTIDGLDGLKNQNPDNVWAALFFCAAGVQGIIGTEQKIEPNNVTYEHDLKAVGIKANKNSIRKYHAYCRLFHPGGESDAGKLLSVSRWIELLAGGDAEAVERYVEESHGSLTREAEEWLGKDADGMTIDRKFWVELSHDYPLYSRAFERIGGEVQNCFRKPRKIVKCRVNI